MTAIDLDHLDRLTNAATPGPWVAEYSGETGNCVLPADAQSTREYVARTQLYHAVADAEFIAAARGAVPALVAEVRRLRATPPAVELSDRQLLAAVHRWARTNGWRWHRWTAGWVNHRVMSHATLFIEWDKSAVIVGRRREGPAWGWNPTVYPVASVTQAVDVLAGLGVLPAELSSAYRAALASVDAVRVGGWLVTPWRGDDPGEAARP